MRVFVKEAFAALRRGDRATVFCLFLGVFVMLLVIAAGAFGQYPIVYPSYPQQPTVTHPAPGTYKWFALTENKNVWTLWRGNEYIGQLDPDLAQWKFAHSKEPQDLSLELDTFWKSNGYNRRGTGALPPKGVGAKVEQAPADKPKLKFEGKADVKEESDRDPANERLPVDGGDGLAPNQRFRGNNFGVDFSGVGKEHVGYSINGRHANASEAFDAIRDGALPNDSELPRLVVIGNEAKRKQVLADFDYSPDLAPFKGKLLVQSYAPNHWHVSAERGFVQPTTADGVVIQAQSASGKVLWRQTDYDGGAPALARALRDKVPGYDPKLDPTPKGSSSGEGLPFSPLWLVAAVGTAIVVWRMRK